jgi:glycosyltransferase involved in cell wall biosynthesis
MTQRINSKARGREVLLIGPKVPPYGGMALQARLMQALMNQEGIPADFLASNLPFPKPLAVLERTRGIRPFLRSAVFCCTLWNKLRRVEVVHILACSWLYFFVVVCPAVLISRLRRKRVILNYRGGEADQFFSWYGPLLKPFFRMAHVVTAPSKFLVEVIGRRIGVAVQVVPNIVNFDSFRYRERETLQPKMVVTRHLLWLYDIESVIRAFAEVQKRYPEASLRIVGTGDQESNLKNLVSGLALQNVAFLGYIPQQDLPAIYDQCDILLNASRADNFPGSLVEAAAAGLVVISTGVGGIPYIFEHEKSALLVKPGDWPGLAAGVLRVLEDQRLASSLRGEALQQCRQYDWSHVRRLLYRMYGFEDDVVGALKYTPSLGSAMGGTQASKLPIEKQGANVNA